MMETILSAQITIPVSQIMMALATSICAFLLGRLKLALIICYGCIFYWSRIWDFPLFNVDAWKFSSPEFIASFFFIIVILLLTLMIIFHHE